MARREVKEDDLAEVSPDHLGAPLDLSDNTVAESAPPSSINPTPPVRPTDTPKNSVVVNASLQEREIPPPQIPDQPSATAAQGSPPMGETRHGTVVLDVEQGGIVVPSFVGKSVRSAIEEAEESGLDLDAIGSGMAKDQSPPAGAHVTAGSRVTVKFVR
jgi:cell division protein FtsI (penicillin-binding protein 3)